MPKGKSYKKPSSRQNMNAVDISECRFPDAPQLQLGRKPWVGLSAASWVTRPAARGHRDHNMPKWKSCKRLPFRQNINQLTYYWSMRFTSSHLRKRLTPWTVGHTTKHFNTGSCSALCLFVFRVQCAKCSGSVQCGVGGALKLESEFGRTKSHSRRGSMRSKSN